MAIFFSDAARAEGAAYIQAAMLYGGQAVVACAKCGTIIRKVRFDAGPRAWKRILKAAAKRHEFFEGACFHDGKEVANE